MNETCFVIMPIGNQRFGDFTITKKDLKQKYECFIKKALLSANPSLTVIRADEEISPGSISNDIFKKLMNSTYVVADITYPNANVFYELGIRHAISPRTILLREKVDIDVPFDISHLRHVVYTTQECGGMEYLAEQLKKHFDFYKQNFHLPDNQFLELCKYVDFTPDVYHNDMLTKSMIQLLLDNPILFSKLSSSSLTDEEKQQYVLNEFTSHPDQINSLIQSLRESGALKF